MGDIFWKKVHDKGVDPHEFATSYTEAAERASKEGAGKLPDPDKALDDYVDKGFIYLEDN